MTPFFHLFFELQLFRKFIFALKSFQNSFYGFSFCPFWSAKYLKFGSESCKNRILSRSILETHTLRKSVKRDFTVSIEFRINSKIFSVISWSTCIFEENNAEKLRNLENSKSNLPKYHYPNSLINKDFRGSFPHYKKTYENLKKPSNENILPFNTALNPNNGNI